MRDKLKEQRIARNKHIAKRPPRRQSFRLFWRHAKRQRGDRRRQRAMALAMWRGKMTDEEKRAAFERHIMEQANG